MYLDFFYQEYFFQYLPPSLSDTIKQTFGAKYDTKNFERYETWKIKSEFLDLSFENNLVSKKDLVKSCGIYRTSRILMRGQVYF